MNILFIFFQFFVATKSSLALPTASDDFYIKNESSILYKTNKNLELSLTYYFNNNESFFYKKNKILIDPGKDLTIIDLHRNQQELRNHYDIDKNIELNYKHNIKFLEYNLATSLYTESHKYEKLFAYTNGEKFLIYNIKNYAETSNFINSSLNFKTNINKLEIKTGLGYRGLGINKKLSLLTRKAQFDFKLGFSYNFETYTLSAASAKKNSIISARFPNYLFSIDYYYKLSNTRIKFERSFSFNRLKLNFAVEKSLNRIKPYSLFKKRYDLHENKLNESFQGNIEIKYPLFNYDNLTSLEVINSYHDKKVFTSDSDEYFHITLKLKNSSEENLNFKIRPQIAGKTFDFKPVNLSSKLIRDIVIKIPKEHFISDFLTKKYFLEIIAEDQYSDVTLLQSEFLVYHPNIWNKKANSLKTFININEIKTHVDTLINKFNFISENNQMSKYRKFNQFIYALGKNLNYRNEAIYNINYDIILSPSEVLAAKKADCEDIVVYFLSCLNYLGIESKIIDIKPTEEEEGHLYLLVDTRLKPTFLETRALNKNNSLRLKNRNGDETLWLPIELTVLRKGFNFAHKVGTKQLLQDLSESTLSRKVEFISSGDL